MGTKKCGQCGMDCEEPKMLFKKINRYKNGKLICEACSERRKRLHFEKSEILRITRYLVQNKCLYCGGNVERHYDTWICRNCKRIDPIDDENVLLIIFERLKPLFQEDELKGRVKKKPFKEKKKKKDRMNLLEL